MALKTVDNITLLDVAEHINHLNVDGHQLIQCGNIPAVVELILQHNCEKILELHSPRGYLADVLCEAFDNVSVTSICNPHTHTRSYANLNCIQDWSCNRVDMFEDGELDLVFVHDHDSPDHELQQTLNQWLPKVKSGGIICGNHFALGTSYRVSKKGMALDLFMVENNLALNSHKGNTFYCINSPVKQAKMRPVIVMP